MLFNAEASFVICNSSEIECPHADKVGPDLSKFSANPDFLRQWLANTAALQPDTRMLGLNLSPEEIEALLNGRFLAENHAARRPYILTHDYLR
jgi:hypothetical protein